MKTKSFYEDGALSVAELTRVINNDIHDYNHERMSFNLNKPDPVAYRARLTRLLEKDS